MSQRNIKIDIGINGCYLAKRWEKAENWIRLTKELGYDYLEFDSDCLDPFFSGSKSYQMTVAGKVRKLAEEEGVRITDYFTGAATHRFHGLSHSDNSVRRRMKQWILDAMDISNALGAGKVGGHFDAFSVETLADQEAFDRQYRMTIDTFRDLAKQGKRKGIRALYLEQMYTPAEVPWTLEQTDKYLCDLAEGNTGCDIFLTVDVGHAAGGWYGLEGDELRYEEWLRRFAAACEVIHLQQTTRDASEHWPFTSKYNEAGDVRIEKIIECVRWSYENCEKQNWSKFIKPPEHIVLMMEVIPRSTTTEEILLRDLAECAAQLREHVPEGGLTLTV